jgi:hypothetical protein
MLALSDSYVLSHLLPIGAWPADVQEALRQGLPLFKGRELARLEEWERQAAIGNYLNQERARAQPPEITGGLAIENGWTLPSNKLRYAPTDVKHTRDTWIYPVLSGYRREIEALHPELVKSILLRYTRAGDRVVDLTAGFGTVAEVGHHLQLIVWSGDIEPQQPFIHRCDARRPLQSPGLAPSCAQLVILHPPTFKAWRDSHLHSETVTYDLYKDFVAELLEGAASVMAHGAHLVLITRPIRAEGRVFNSIGALIETMEDTFGPLKGYHVAVEQHGEEDWHVLVGQEAVNISAQHEGHTI